MRRVLLGAACTSLALGLWTGLAAARLHAQPPPGPALTVTGTLVDEEGAPAAGLDLELRPSPSRYERRLEDLGESGPLSAIVDSTRSGPDGAFTLSAPAVGPYRLEISARPENAAPEARGVAVAPVSHSLAPLAAPTVLPPIEVPNWHTLTVGAKDLDGQPVEGALVVVDPVLWRSERAEANVARPRWNQPRQRIYPRFWRAAARTDAGGGYQAYRVPSGPARIVARHPDYRDGVAEVVIEGGTNEVDLKLQPGWEISGTVTTAAGAPLALARVEAYLIEPPASLDDLSDARRQALPRVPLEAVTDQSGNYRIGGLDHGRYELRAHADGYARAASGRFPVRIDGVSVAGVDLNPPAVLAGTVIDAVTREPVAGANLVAIVVDPEAELAPGAEEEWIPAGFTQSNAKGEYRLEFAPRMTTSLMVQRQGYDGFGVPLELTPGERRGGFLIELQPE